MAVDATAFGTTCVRVRTKSELDMILLRMEDGDGLKLIRDLTFDYEFLEEGRNLSLVDDQGVNSKSDMYREIEKHELLENGTYKPHLKFAFFQLSAVEKTCKELAKTLCDKDAERRKSEVEGNEKDGKDNEDEDEDEDDVVTEKISYTLTGREWVVPETCSNDIRVGDSRYASGGCPQQVGSSRASSEPPPVKRITKYMTGEPDDKKNMQKVYIDEEAVVNCDASCILVEFKQTSYNVVANADMASYILGPIECGHIVPNQCTWRLSRGRRLTITLARSKLDYSSTAPTEEGLASWQIIGVFVTFVLAIVLLAVVGMPN